MGVSYCNFDTSKSNVISNNINDLDARLSKEIELSASTCMKHIDQEISSLKVKQNLFSKQIRREIDKSWSHCIEECNQALSTVSGNISREIKLLSERQDLAAHDLEKYRDTQSDMHIEIDTAIKELKNKFNVAIVVSAGELVVIIGLICNIFF